MQAWELNFEIRIFKIMPQKSGFFNNQAFFWNHWSWVDFSHSKNLSWWSNNLLGSIHVQFWTNYGSGVLKCQDFQDYRFKKCPISQKLGLGGKNITSVTPPNPWVTRLSSFSVLRFDLLSEIIYSFSALIHTIKRYKGVKEVVGRENIKIVSIFNS